MSIIEELEATGEVVSLAVRAALERLEALAVMVPSLQERVRELEARLGLNSTNSSKPPSSDPPGVVRALKKPTGKKRGGQKGHRGHQQAHCRGPRRRIVGIARFLRYCGLALSGRRREAAWCTSI